MDAVEKGIITINLREELVLKSAVGQQSIKPRKISTNQGSNLQQVEDGN